MIITGVVISFNKFIFGHPEYWYTLIVPDGYHATPADYKIWRETENSGKEFILVNVSRHDINTKELYYLEEIRMIVPDYIADLYEDLEIQIPKEKSLITYTFLPDEDFG